VEFELTETQLQLRDSVRALVRSFEPEYWRNADRKARFPIEFHKACGEMGLFGTMLPEEYGGVGLGVTEAAIVLRAIAESDAGLDGCSVVHMSMFGLNPIVRHGTDTQKERYLRLAGTGELQTCFAVTEPTAGTDTTRITTSACLVEDRYVVNGRKVWISRAQEADLMLLLCRTTPFEEVQKKTDGMTLLLAPVKDPAVTLREIGKMGRKAVDSNEMFIDNLEVSEANRIGEEGRGFYCLLDGLNPERVMVASEAVGLGFHVTAMAAAYARDREVFGRPIGQNQGVQFPLADAYSMLRAADLLVMEAAWRYDNGLSCAAEANMAKLRASEAAHCAVNAAFETFGGFGFAEEYDIERFYRQVPLIRVTPITNNLVKAYLAQHVLGLPKSY